ncbi:MAG TPA: type II toxin-antitoxin system HicB family antitoxin [Bdellovibrionota bacterium]|nr:type II toxin-antitoxin system HicB family antitoxin [Bdellovibrionota bacterium]
MMYFEAKIRKEGKGYRVTFPGLPNVFTYAESFDCALTSAREALEGCLLEDLNRGLDLPVPRRYSRKRETHLIPVSLEIGIALLLRKLRREKGWTTRLVANKLRISRQAYEKLERGTGNPSVETLERTLAVFGVKAQIQVQPLLSSDVRRAA